SRPSPEPARASGEPGRCRRRPERSLCIWKYGWSARRNSYVGAVGPVLKSRRDRQRKLVLLRNGVPQPQRVACPEQSLRLPGKVEQVAGVDTEQRRALLVGAAAVFQDHGRIGEQQRGVVAIDQ